MKLHAIAIAIALATALFAGIAAAGDASPMAMPSVAASVTEVSGCTPPNDKSRCEDFHRIIRANFSAREIGVLFGASTAYPASLSGRAERLQKRYEVLVQELVAAQRAAGAGVARAK